MLENFEAEMRLAWQDADPDFGLIIGLCVWYAPFINRWLDSHLCSVMGNRMAAQRWANVWRQVRIWWAELPPETAVHFPHVVMADKRLRGLGLL